MLIHNLLSGRPHDLVVRRSTPRLLLDLLTARRCTERAKDLEIALLRQQLRLLQRQQTRPPRLRPADRTLLAVLAHALSILGRAVRSPWHQSCLLVTPATMLRWHRELVRRKWTVRRRPQGGRPPLDADLSALIVRLARENPRWGYKRIQGELLKLGQRVGRSTIRDVLKRAQIPPAPQRSRRGPSWRTFCRHYRQQVLACDFFVVETALLRSIFVLFFLEVRTRKVYLAGCTPHPTSAWVTQQARNLVWPIQDGTLPVTVLLHDRDGNFPAAFDRVFASEGLQVVRTPPRCPWANGYAERWIGSVQSECLDHLLILNERHLRRVLTAYIAFYNERRPPQGLGQRCPVPLTRSPGEGPVGRHDLLGGIVHDYGRVAA
jgi:transposase InsO family protein